MSEDELAFLPICQLGARLRARRDLPVELAKFYLARLDGVGRRLNAVVTITEDIALREATLAEAELRDGLDRGPLHGIPYGLKDIIATVGTPTTWGAEPFRHQHFEHEATVARRLREAGAVLVAKLATIEIAGGMGYDNPDASLSGPPANPWDINRWTNGSSSGPAAAVAAGCRALRHRQRHRRVNPIPGRLHGCGRAARDLRPGQPRGRHGAVLDPGPAGAHVPLRRGLRLRAGSHRRLRSR